MVGVRCNGKTRVETHQFDPTLTPVDAVTQVNGKFVRINRHLTGPTEPQQEDTKAVKQEKPDVKDGLAFPLMVGGSPEKAGKQPKTASAWERTIDVTGVSAFPSLSGAAKPVEKVPTLTNATLRIVSGPKHKRVAALRK